MKKTLTGAICFLMLLFAIVACSSGSVAPYVVQAYKVVNDAVGVVRNIQEHPETVAEKIGPVLQGLETVRNSLALAAKMLGVQDQLPAPKANATPEVEQLIASTKELAELNAKAGPMAEAKAPPKK